ncbi:MAG: CinA family protein [Firmicutes bacterium]|nr:CinA family protein [Bacillota bacterium]
MEKIVKKLRDLNKTIATMESCTGGAVVNAITNIEGASEVVKYSAVTYSNEFKIKMGVSKNSIDKYSVYSIEVAKEMSKQISLYATSNYGLGITGKLNRVDKNNLYGLDNRVFISLYDKDNDAYYTSTVDVNKNTREGNKNLVIEVIKNILISSIK